MRKLFSVFAVSTMLACSGLMSTTQAADIHKTSNFKVIFADSETSTEVEGQEEGQPQEGEVQDSQDNEAALSVGELISSVYSLSSQEKFNKVSAYLQSNPLDQDQFKNLLSGLSVAKLSSKHGDSLVGFYVSLNQAAYNFKSFRSFLKILSDEAFTEESKTKNIPFMMADLYVDKNAVDYKTHKKLVKFLKSNDMPRDLVDENILPKGVAKINGTLSIYEFKSLLSLMDSHYRNVQTRGLMVASYTVANAARLAEERFREEILDLEQTVPQDDNLAKINNLQFDARETLFYIEFEYFKGTFEKDLFFTWNKVIKQVRDNVDVKHQNRVVKTLLKRNAHRLTAKKNAKMLKAFSM
ncbi:MAG: hypothetical protein COB02_17405 [Candidatus Cloacimonadota bacterium]|nr:MAG: hypothetical protein COB02_17405 [Candidatus Cloacimonadota bacterium]